MADTLGRLKAKHFFNLPNLELKTLFKTMSCMKINGIKHWPAYCTKYWIKGCVTRFFIAVIVTSAKLHQLAGILVNYQVPGTRHSECHVLDGTWYLAQGCLPLQPPGVHQSTVCIVPVYRHWYQVPGTS